MELTYDELKLRIAIMKEQTKRYSEEMSNRSKFVKDVLKMEHASDDALFAMYRVMCDCAGRELSKLKEIIKAYPEYRKDNGEIIKKMWSGLSECETNALKLMKMELGDERFKAICKQGYDIMKARIARDVRQREADEQEAERVIAAVENRQTIRAAYEVETQEEKSKAIDYMMRGNYNRFGGENL